MRNKMYISGAISSKIEKGEEWKSSFNKIAERYKNDYIVVNPVVIGEGLEGCYSSMRHYNITPNWVDYMLACLEQLLLFTDKDIIYMLPGWECSKGARVELATARALGCRVIEGVL